MPEEGAPTPPEDLFTPLGRRAWAVRIAPPPQRLADAERQEGEEEEEADDE